MYIYITMFYMFYVCVFNVFFSSNLYLYNTVLSVLFCVNKDIIISYCGRRFQPPQHYMGLHHHRREWRSSLTVDRFMQPHTDPQCETIKVVQQCNMEEKLQPSSLYLKALLTCVEYQSWNLSLTRNTVQSVYMQTR